jgi:DNA-binding response OmpR family regulator
MTADATERQHARLIAAGATAYLTKPIDVRQLLALVDSNLPKSHLEPRGSANALSPRP